MSEEQCKLCDHTWRPRKDSPDQCPNCRTEQWRRPTFKIIKCKRCRNQWLPYKQDKIEKEDGEWQNLPSRCPECGATPTNFRVKKTRKLPDDLKN